MQGCAQHSNTTAAFLNFLSPSVMLMTDCGDPREKLELASLIWRLPRLLQLLLLPGQISFLAPPHLGSHLSVQSQSKYDAEQTHLGKAVWLWLCSGRSGKPDYPDFMYCTMDSCPFFVSVPFFHPPPIYPFPSHPPPSCPFFISPFPFSFFLISLFSLTKTRERN